MSGEVRPGEALKRPGDPAFEAAIRSHAAELARSVELGDVPSGLPGFMAELRAMAEYAGVDQASQAHAALARQTADALEAILAPPSWGERTGALLAWVGSRLRLGAADGAPPALQVEARQAAADLARTLAASNSAARRAAAEDDWDPVGCLAVLEAMPPEQQVPFALELADVIGWPALLDAAARFPPGSVPDRDAATTLRPDGLVGRLLAVAGTVPAALAYAKGVGGRAADNVLSDLPSLLVALPVPAALSRPVSALLDVLSARFGPSEAVEFTRAVLLARLLAPSLAPDLAAALADLLATEPGEALEAVDDALTEFTEEVAAAGRAAEAAVRDGEDADDLLVQRGAVLLDADSVRSAFRAPTPADKLGTMPVSRTNALGHAILDARAKRPDSDVDWAALVDVKENSPAEFEAFILAERCAVLDLIDFTP